MPEEHETTQQLIDTACETIKILTQQITGEKLEEILLQDKPMEKKSKELFIALRQLKEGVLIQ